MIEILSNTWENLKQFSMNYLACFLFQCFIEVATPTSEMFGVIPGEMPYILLQLLVAVLTVWNFTLLIHVFSNNQNAEKPGLQELIKESIFDTPAFFLYSLLYGLTVLIGFLFFAIPGFYALLFHYFAPIAAVMDPDLEDPEESYFAYSRRLVRSHWGVVLGILIIMIILNVVVPLICLIPTDSTFRLNLDILLTMVDSFLILFANILVLQTYQYLKKGPETRIPALV